MVSRGVISGLVVAVVFATPTLGFFDQFFQQQQQQNKQQQQQRQKHNHEAVFMQTTCDKYVCSDTLECVETPGDCPCPYPNSQVKCPFPDHEGGYVCVSIGERGCDWVEKAYNGLV